MKIALEFDGCFVENTIGTTKIPERIPDAIPQLARLLHSGVEVAIVYSLRSGWTPDNSRQTILFHLDRFGQAEWPAIINADLSGQLTITPRAPIGHTYYAAHVRQFTSWQEIVDEHCNRG